MKKTYTSPLIKILHFERAAVLCESSQETGEEHEDNF
mgnify:CR=1 FL=1